MESITSIRLTAPQTEFIEQLKTDPKARTSFLADAMAWLRRQNPVGSSDRSRVPEAVRHALKVRGIE